MSNNSGSPLATRTTPPRPPPLPVLRPSTSGNNIVELNGTAGSLHNNHGGGTEEHEVQRSVYQPSPLCSGQVHNGGLAAPPMPTLNAQCSPNTLRSPTAGPYVFGEAEEF